ncbi:MAG TPA: DUF2089 domain-containing protein [Candidatus Limnocylindria bacterium]|nr:DUF2089 domain-containing protein [Candidatus Limnocylindria bacterium]
MAPRDVIATCPVCSGELEISRLHCSTCGTTIEGEFGVGRFGRLSHEQMALLESFLRSRGNLKEMERALGISYPTVRARVEALVQALGLADGDQVDIVVDVEPELTDPTLAAARREILERLAKGDIDAAGAAEALRGVESKA